ncbi:hypothetical protein ACOMHN_062687 [Nucella lapillus]
MGHGLSANETDDNKMAAERRKVASTSDERNLDTDKQFLERTQVNSVIRDVIAKLIANRPEDPVTFLADYFEAVVEEQSSLVQRALRVITMTHHSRPVFEVNVRDAYSLLSKHKVNKKLRGVNGAVYTELLQALCKNLPSTVTIKLVKKLECFDYEAVTFDVFRSSIFTCCVLREYASVAEQLFGSLDIQKTGKADKALCEAVMDQLKAALGGSRNDVKRIIESSYSLGPEGLHHALERALSRDQPQGVFTTEQFVTEACDSFLAKVKRLKMVMPGLFPQWYTVPLCPCQRNKSKLHSCRLSLFLSQLYALHCCRLSLFLSQLYALHCCRLSLFLSQLYALHCCRLSLFLSQLYALHCCRLSLFLSQLYALHCCRLSLFLSQLYALHCCRLSLFLSQLYALHCCRLSLFLSQLYALHCCRLSLFLSQLYALHCCRLSLFLSQLYALHCCRLSLFLSQLYALHCCRLSLFLSQLYALHCCRLSLFLSQLYALQCEISGQGMTEPLHAGAAMEPTASGTAVNGGKPLTIARIARAIAILGEKGGSTALKINRMLEKELGIKTSNAELKRMLIRAVQAGKVRHSPRTNRFFLKLPSNYGGMTPCRRRRRKGRGRGGKKKKKGKGRRRRRRRRRKGKGKGKGKKKGRGKRRRRRRRRKGKGKKRCRRESRT